MYPNSGGTTDKFLFALSLAAQGVFLCGPAGRAGFGTAIRNQRAERAQVKAEKL